MNGTAALLRKLFKTLFSYQLSAVLHHPGGIYLNAFSQAKLRVIRTFHIVYQTKRIVKCLLFILAMRTPVSPVHYHTLFAQTLGKLIIPAFCLSEKGMVM